MKNNSKQDQIAAVQAWEHYDMRMRCWRAGTTNPGHPYHGSSKPKKPKVKRPASCWVIKSGTGLYLTLDGEWSTERNAAAEYDDYESCRANAVAISRDAESDEDEYAHATSEL